MDYEAKAREIIPQNMASLNPFLVYDFADALRQAAAEAWEDVARFGVEWMKNPGGVDARFIAAIREQAHQTVLANIGYMAGYYDDAAAEKVYRLFKVKHPVFGMPGYHKNIPSEAAVKIGMKMAKEVR